MSTINGEVLFAVTLTQPGDTDLDRHYGTYSIIAEKLWWHTVNGSMLPPHAHWYKVYKVLSEFAQIVGQLMFIDKFDQYRLLWYDALQAAVQQALNDTPIEEPNRAFLRKLRNLLKEQEERKS